MEKDSKPFSIEEFSKSFYNNTRAVKVMEDTPDLVYNPVNITKTLRIQIAKEAYDDLSKKRNRAITELIKNKANIESIVDSVLDSGLTTSFIELSSKHGWILD